MNKGDIEELRFQNRMLVKREREQAFRASVAAYNGLANDTKALAEDLEKAEKRAETRASKFGAIPVDMQDHLIDLDSRLRDMRKQLIVLRNEMNAAKEQML